MIQQQTTGVGSLASSRLDEHKPLPHARIPGHPLGNQCIQPPLQFSNPQRLPLPGCVLLRNEEQRVVGLSGGGDALDALLRGLSLSTAIKRLAPFTPRKWTMYSSAKDG